MSQRPRLSRRSILQSTGAAAAYALAGSPPGLAQEKSDLPRGAADQRLSLGVREIFVLSDGHLVVPAAALAENAPPADVSCAAGSTRDRAQPRQLPHQCRAGENGRRLHADRCGLGWHLGADRGQAHRRLAAAGIQPEQIGKVVLTHAPPDHIWGLIDELDDSLRFPRAQYVVAAREFDFWTSGRGGRPQGRSKASRRAPARVQGDRGPHRAREARRGGRARYRRHRHGRPYAGHISLWSRQARTSCSSPPTPCRTPTSRWHIPIGSPARTIDAGTKAAASRRRLLDMAATDKLRVLSYHIPFPGLGRVERKGSAYAWIAGA